MKQLINNRAFQFSLILIVGLFLGWLFFSSSTEDDHNDTTTVTEETVWTCSMHPQIRQNEPGDCPICGMELIPLTEDKESGEKNNFTHTLSESAAALANVQTEKVKSQSPEYQITLIGKVHPNEKKLAVITADYSGRIEKLFVDFTGETVRKGEKLGTIYSPELVTAQKELIESAKSKEKNPIVYRAVKEKLRLWNLTDKQIEMIESNNKVFTELDIYSDINGIVLKRIVSQGDYVNKGEILFEIADLSSVWVMLDAYESDLPWIKTGDKIELSAEGVPGKTFNSTISFIDPIINQDTRTASVRTELNNPNLLLKPGMFANAKVKSDTESGTKEELLISKTSVLWTGKRSVVFVKVPGSDSHKFEMREIVLGARAGDHYVVKKGLTEGEEIVSNGAFAIDAAAQLSGKFSMMNRPESKRYSIPDKFKDQLTNLVNNYFQLKDALVETDLQKSKKAVKNLSNSLQQIDMSLLEEEPHHKWMEMERKLKSSIESIAQSADVESVRKYFESISDVVIEAADLFGLNKEMVYVQFCPMAFDDKGANWLSETEEILNPYFGDMMLNCGEVTKEISSVDSYKEKDEKSQQPMEHQH